MSDRWWHYTVGPKLLSIVEARNITRARTRVGGNERGAVWFSRRPDWEPTATKGKRVAGTPMPVDMTIPEMVEQAGALVRLEVSEDIARHSWADHRRIGQVDPRVADALERAAHEHGADPLDWRVSYHDVPTAEVLSVEASVDGVTWVSVGLPGALDPDFVSRVTRPTGQPTRST
jgi:hypothetical protein